MILILILEEFNAVSIKRVGLLVLLIMVMIKDNDDKVLSKVRIFLTFPMWDCWNVHVCRILLGEIKMYKELFTSMMVNTGNETYR